MGIRLLIMVLVVWHLCRWSQLDRWKRVADFCCPAARPAPQVVALREENDQLKATLVQLLNSPLNRELQLPPTLLLQ